MTELPGVVGSPPARRILLIPDSIQCVTGTLARGYAHFNPRTRPRGCGTTVTCARQSVTRQDEVSLQVLLCARPRNRCFRLGVLLSRISPRAPVATIPPRACAIARLRPREVRGTILLHLMAFTGTRCDSSARSRLANGVCAYRVKPRTERLQDAFCATPGCRVRFPWMRYAYSCGTDCRCRS